MNLPYPLPIPGSRPADNVIGHILKGIEQGYFLPGQRLIEAELVDECGLGRGPVREALQILTGEGVVEIVPFKGARVKLLTAEEIIERLEIFNAMVAMAIRKLLSEPGGNISIIIENLEPYLARIATPVMSREIFQALQASALLHREICRMTGSKYLMESVDRLQLAHLNRELTRILELNAEKQEILDHIADINKNILHHLSTKDIAKAQSALLVHYSDLEHYIGKV